MKGKNIEKIAEKMKAIGKAKVEKDEKGNEYIIFDSDMLPCAQKVRAGFLERDLFYIRNLMITFLHILKLLKETQAKINDFF